MAVFTTGSISSVVQGHTDDGIHQEMEAPLIGSMRMHSRPKKKKSRWQKPAYYVGAALVVSIVAGAFVLSQKYGGDKVASQSNEEANMINADDDASLRSIREQEARGAAQLSQKHLVHAHAQKIAASTQKSATSDSKESKDHVKPKKQPDADEKSQQDFSHFLDKNHAPEHTLAEALKKSPEEQNRGRHHDLHGGEYKAKSSFAQEYANYLDKQHGTGHTLHGTGVHPDTYHPTTTTASHGDSFSRWLDRTHPVVQARPARPQHAAPHERTDTHTSDAATDRTGESGHYGKGWYHTHNLHASLGRAHQDLPSPPQQQRSEPHVSRDGRAGHASEHVHEHVSMSHEPHERISFGHRAPEETESQHETAGQADRRVREHEAQEQQREQAQREGATRAAQHYNPKTAQHLTLHERNQVMESREGHYAFLSPAQRWAREEYDAIQASQQARAKADEGLRNLQHAMHNVERASAAAKQAVPIPAHASEASAPRQQEWESDGGMLGKFKGDAGGVLSHIAKDDHLTGGVLSNFDEGDRPAPDSRTTREANGVLSQVKAQPNNGNWLEGIGGN